ncbi:hypothetical protein TRVL_02017 [Trypanosoma vivax]|nr:hypothetical protein TRVL_02017 [Trypanosoma vivax]
MARGGADAPEDSEKRAGKRSVDYARNFSLIVNLARGEDRQRRVHTRLSWERRMGMHVKTRGRAARERAMAGICGQVFVGSRSLLRSEDRKITAQAAPRQPEQRDGAHQKPHCDTVKGAKGRAW